MRKRYSMYFLPLGKCSIINGFKTLIASICVFSTLSAGAQKRVSAYGATTHASSISQQPQAQAGMAVRNNVHGAISAAAIPAERSQETNPLREKWKAKPFDHRVFVENNGQFEHVLPENIKVLFFAQVGKMKAYFTPQGMIYSYDTFIREREENGEEGEDSRDGQIKKTSHYLYALWEGSNADVTVNAEEEQNTYYTYGMGVNQTIRANIFKKITYHNIYPGIDLVYTLPEDKGGIKYAVIVHPGADISQLKLNYQGTEILHIDKQGNVTEHPDDSCMGDMIDHTPESYYQNGGVANISYSVNGRVESFQGNYDRSRTLVIDPYTTDPNLTSGGYDEAYDIDYDNAGNVYAYGGFDPFQLSKINSAGTVVWTFTCPGNFDPYAYGDIAVDKTTGNSFLVEGFYYNGRSGAEVLKVNSSGLLTTTYGGSSKMREMWRATYNVCTGQLIAGGGGTNSSPGQVAIFNTALTSITEVNTLGLSTCCHDVDNLSFDPTGNTAYFGMSTKAIGVGQSATDSNYIVSVPVPALSPYNYTVIPTGDALVEAQSVAYVGWGYDVTSNETAANGMNGMAASPNWLYTYDGYKLRQRNKASGAQNNSVSISTYNTNYSGYNETNVYWGGLDADACDNVYVGNVSNSSTPRLLVYNSSLVLQSNTTLPDYPYDVVLGTNDATIYVCGGPVYWEGNTGTPYVKAFTNSISTVSATTSAVTNTTCGLNNGSATANLTLCGSTPAGISYLWSPGGQTTQTVTGLAAGTYTVSMTVGCGDIYQATVTIGASVNNPPTSVTASSNSPVCSGGTINLTGGATGATSWSWTGPNGFSSSSQNPSITGATTVVAGTYTLTAINACGSAKNTVTVVIDTLPTAVSASSNSPICQGTTLNLTGSATGATSWGWTGPNGFTSGSQNPSIAGVTMADTGVYTLTATNSCGSTKSTVHVTINPLPSAVTASSNSPICQGDTLKLNGSATNATGWSWTGPGGFTSGSQDTSIAEATTGATGTYTFTATNACGPTSNTVAVTVNPTPTVSVTPPNPAICQGNSVGLTASGASNYTWLPSTGLSCSTCSNPNANPSGTTTYSVVGTSGAGCNDTAQVTITVNPTPTITITGGTTICPSGSTILTVSGANTYSWSPATGLSSATDSVVTANPAGTQTYTITGTTPEGCTGTGNVTLTVVPTLTVTITASSSSICSGGGSTTLTAGGASIYTWKPATGLSSTTGTSVTATPTATTTYTLIGTAGSGCSDSTTQTITVNPTPTLTVTAGSGTICPGGSGTTVTVSGATTYSWSPATGLSSATDSVVNANPGSTQTYTVTGTTGAGCSASAPVTITVDNPTVSATAAPPAICNGSSTSLNATGGVSYAWSPSTGLSCTNCPNPTVSGLATGTTTYNVTDTDANGCTATGSVSITVNPLPVITALPSDTILCNGGTVSLTAGGASTYVWTPSGSLSCASCPNPIANPSGTTTYTVTGTDGNGCSNTTTLTITVNPTPTLSISLSGGDTLCSGQSVTMTASGATNYTWSPATGLSCNTCPNPVATPPSSPIIYTVTGSTGPCTASASDTLYLYPPLNVAIVADSICVGKNGTIGAVVSGGKTSYTYVWTNVPGSGNSGGPYTVNPAVPTYYVCTVTDGCGTHITDSAQVFTYPTPVAAFVPTPDTLLGGQFVSFVNNSTGATSWYWTFGDGGTSTNGFPYYQYNAQGVYIVTLTASNGNGCSDTKTDTVYVIGGITVPNVFTPNGDGQNDVFHITAGGMKTYNIEIFNRWGEKVFEANSPNIDWDGRSMSGVEESDGAYYYIIKATDYSEKAYNLKGYLQLIRGK